MIMITIRFFGHMSTEHCMIIVIISKLDIFPLMCATDEVWIMELTLIHTNIGSIRNSHVQEYCQSDGNRTKAPRQKPP